MRVQTAMSSRVYIAGPFSAPTPEEVQQNILNAEYYGLVVTLLGGKPVIPHANTQHPAFEQAAEYSFWIEHTTDELATCGLALFIPGWHQSKGAFGEYEQADAWGIRRYISASDKDRFRLVTALHPRGRVPTQDDALKIWERATARATELFKKHPKPGVALAPEVGT